MSATTRAKKRAAARKPPTQPTGTRVETEARLRWVPIAKMKVEPGTAQRMKLNRSRVDYIASNLDVEQIGHPTVNFDGEHYWILDGWHRVEALKASGWGDQQIQCWVYEELTQSEMAETFLRLNDTLTVSAFDKFTKAVQAGHEVECDIDRIVRAQGLHVSRERKNGGVSAVGALKRAYLRAGDATLSRTLIMIRDAYGTAGFDSAVIDGINHLCNRYNGELETQTAIRKLSEIHGGVNGLLNRAETLRRQTGNQKSVCVAAAAVEQINSGRGGKKLPPWWKS